MAATTAPLMTTAGVPAASFSDFNWQNEDFSWLTTGQGFGTGNPAELYLNGWDFSWLPDNLPPKAQPGVDIPVTDHPIPTGVDTSKGWVESFDSGPGLFGRYWGGGVDFSTPGQVTIHRTADDGDSGMMVPPTGASAGSGYGLFSWTLSMTGKIGVYALAWPGMSAAVRIRV